MEIPIWNNWVKLNISYAPSLIKGKYINFGFWEVCWDID